jgi:hypothetical protein
MTWSLGISGASNARAIPSTCLLIFSISLYHAPFPMNAQTFQYQRSLPLFWYSATLPYRRHFKCHQLCKESGCSLNFADISYI